MKRRKYRDFSQRQAYAARRMSKAVDRLILATGADDREKTRKWVEAWAIVSGIRTPAQAPSSATTRRKLRLVKGQVFLTLANRLDGRMPAAR